MLALVAFMVSILLVAALVVAYVAYPHRGRDLPAAPWLGAAMRRGVDSLPTVADGELDPSGADRGQDARPAGPRSRG